MTEVKFNAKNWFEDYNWRLNDAPLKRQLSTSDGVSVHSIYNLSREKIVAHLDLKIDTDVIVKIDNKDVNVNVSFFGSNHMYYRIETNISSEDAAQAEQNLNAAIKSGRTVFKVPTVAIVDGKPWPSVYQPAIRDRDDNLLIEMTEALRLFESALSGEETDLGDYSFLKDMVPTLKDERIEILCDVPEELMISGNLAAKQKFHAEDWVNYYNAKIDERYLSDYIDNCFEGYPDAKIEMSGDTITTHVESGFSYCIGMIFEDAETGEEIETESDVVADFAYTVVYKVDDDLDDFIEDIEEALNNAINNEESAFKIIAPIKVVEVRNVEVTDVENHGLDDEIVARINGGESAIVREIQSSIERDLSEAIDARHSGDFIQPPIDKEVKFICTIPTK